MPLSNGDGMGTFVKLETPRENQLLSDFFFSVLALAPWVAMIWLLWIGTEETRTAPVVENSL
jgi:hypothetical protein